MLIDAASLWLGVDEVFSVLLGRNTEEKTAAFCQQSFEN